MLFKESNNNFIRGRWEKTRVLDLSGSLGAMGNVRAFWGVNCPGAEGTEPSRVTSGGVGDINIIQLAGEGGRSKEPLRTKHHSLGGKGWVILRTVVFMFVCTNVSSESDGVCRLQERQTLLFIERLEDSQGFISVCWECRSLNPDINNYHSKFAA